MIELMDCPFCGSAVAIVENVWAEPAGVWCKHCGLMARFSLCDDKESITRAWNRRDDNIDTPN